MSYVPPEGPRDRPLLAIVGEAPGHEEAQQGRPFVGSSGMLLNQMLASAGIDRRDVYITNVSKIRPPGNDFGRMFYEDEKRRIAKPELIKLHEEVFNEIKAVAPKVVVVLGAEALKAITGYESIKNYRGMMIDRFGLRIMPTYHPSYILRGMYEERPVAEADFKKALRQARTPYIPQPSINFDPTFSEVMAFLKRRPESLAMDIETLKNQTRCIGFAWDRLNAISIPLMKGRSHAWTLEQEIEILQAMSDLFADPRVGFTLQNVMYDATVLAKEFGFYIANLRQDTMLAHHLLYPELPKGLDFQCSIYTDHPMYWNYDRGDWKSTGLYNGMDCVVTYECADIHEREMKERGVYEFYKSIPNRAVMALLYAQSRGVKIDVEARAEIRRKTEQEQKEIVLRIKESVGYEVSPSSPKQVSTLVYDKWQLPKQLHHKTKKPTTDDDALRALARKHPFYSKPLLDILEHRQKQVLISTFCDMELCNGRVFTSYNVGGTVTSRLSSSSTYDGLGGNLQNIPRGTFRRIFVADDKKVLVKADLSQAEYRVLIWKARIHRVIKRWLTEPGFNIHKWNACENIYRISAEQMTQEQYSNAKNGVYGANYGIGPLKVSRMYNIDFQDAKFIIERYHQAVPEVKNVYQREIEETLRETRKIINPLGRERIFFGRLDEETYRAAYSHYAQSTVADLILLAAIDLVDMDVDVLLQVHDELVVQCDDTPEAIRLTVNQVRSAMERPLQFDGVEEPLVIPCEIKVGRNWYDTSAPEKYIKEYHGEVQLPQEVQPPTGKH